MSKLKVFEAFAGYGSQSIALRNIGVDYEVIAISEIDKYAIQAYEAIHGKVNNLGDISKIDVSDVPEHDLFTYSFPCQDLSVAGKQKGLGKGTRSGLLYECEKIIEHCRPKYLLLENVKNLVSKKFKPQFYEWLRYLKSLGYTNYTQVLNAKDYGIPQNRERVFVVSIYGEHKPYKFPTPMHLTTRISDILEDSIDPKYYINKPFHLVSKVHQAELDIKDYNKNKRIYSPNGVEPTVIATLGGVPKILIPQAICYGEKAPLKLPCIAASRGRNPENPSSRVAGEHTEQRLEFNTEGISNTITTVQKDNYLLEPQYKIRKLTPRECFRLMGMNDNDIDKIQQSGISNSQQYKLAGNSIVVNVLEGIFKNLFEVE